MSASERHMQVVHWRGEPCHCFDAERLAGLMSSLPTLSGPALADTLATLSQAALTPKEESE